MPLNKTQSILVFFFFFFFCISKDGNYFWTLSWCLNYRSSKSGQLPSPNWFTNFSLYSNLSISTVALLLSAGTQIILVLLWRLLLSILSSLVIPSSGLNGTITVLLQEWLWHWITHKGWYTIKQTKPLMMFGRSLSHACLIFHLNSFACIFGYYSE